MRKYRKPIITPMQPEDFAEVCSWEEKYKDDKDFESLKQYIAYEAQEYKESEILYGNPDVNIENYSLVDLFQHNYFDSLEKQDDFDEMNTAYALKNEKGEIVAWVLAALCDLPSHVNPLYVMGFAVHPKHQNKGYGTMLMNNLISDPVKYFGSKPDKYYIYMQKDCPAGVALLNKFGFKVSEGENCVCGFTYKPTPISESQPSSNE